MKIISRKEAKKKGLKRYFTGEPCIRNHISERGVAGKNCLECSKIHEKKYNLSSKGKEKRRLCLTSQSTNLKKLFLLCFCDVRLDHLE